MAHNFDLPGYYLDNVISVLTTHLEVAFQKHSFRVGYERKLEVMDTVIIVQHTPRDGHGMFTRMDMDVTAETFTLKSPLDYDTIANKVVTRLMLLGLD